MSKTWDGIEAATLAGGRVCIEYSEVADVYFAYVADAGGAYDSVEAASAKEAANGAIYLAGHLESNRDAEATEVPEQDIYPHLTRGDLLYEIRAVVPGPEMELQLDAMDDYELAEFLARLGGPGALRPNVRGERPYLRLVPEVEERARPPVGYEQIDVAVQREGGMFTFELLTPRAQQWVDDYVEDPMFHGRLLVVEGRFARDLAQGMLDDGLAVE